MAVFLSMLLFLLALLIPAAKAESLPGGKM
jgi:hypothetical protein